MDEQLKKEIQRGLDNCLEDAATVDGLEDWTVACVEPAIRDPIYRHYEPLTVQADSEGILMECVGGAVDQYKANRTEEGLNTLRDALWQCAEKFYRHEQDRFQNRAS